MPHTLSYSARLLIPLLLLCMGQSRPAAPATMPAPATVAEAVGVNIHFTTAQKGEMKMLADLGLRWVRMDLDWAQTEKDKGKYDFSAYDKLLAELARHGLRPMFILDYSNPLYDGGLSPHSDEGRSAFARWAAAAVKHFRDGGILWELYNEPNIDHFWKPKADVHAYTRLALAAAKAIREAAPQEVVIGPATSQIDLPFLQECFKAGLLDYWSAVTVHPYRKGPPESAAAEYIALGRLIALPAAGRTVGIVSGEWGYASHAAGVPAELQGKMLARQWLANIAGDVPLSIWYDWRDDGNDANDAEHNFGMVAQAYHAGASPVYDAKPAYNAARALLASLGKMKCSKRFEVGSGDDFVLLFADGNDLRLAAWTTAPEHTVVLPASTGRFDAADFLGRPLAPLATQAVGLVIALTDAPQYLTPQSPNELLQLAAAWTRVPACVFVPAQRGVQVPLLLTNTLGRAIKVQIAPGKTVEVPPGESVTLGRPFDVLRNDEPVRIRAALAVDDFAPLVQEMVVAATNPLRLWPFPPAGGSVAVRVENPSGQALEGVLRLTDGEETGLAAPLSLAAGQLESTVSVPLHEAAVYRFGVEIRDAAGVPQMTLPVSAYTFVDDFGRYDAKTLPKAYQIMFNDEMKAASAQSLSLEAGPAGPPAPRAGCLQIAYDLNKGGFIRLVPLDDSAREIEGKPSRLTLWIHGNGSGLSPRLRVIDASGQTFQPEGPSITWHDWRLVTIPLDGRSAGHWGGANDGVIHYPIRWNTLLLLDSQGQKSAGDIYISCPTLW